MNQTYVLEPIKDFGDRVGQPLQERVSASIIMPR